MANKKTIDNPITPDHVKKASPKIKKAYNEWVETRKQLHNHPNRYYTIQDPDEPSETKDIDLIQAISNIRKWTRHLDAETRTAIELGWKELHNYKMRLAKYKRIWNPPKYGVKGSLNGLDPYAAEIVDLFGQWKTTKEIQKIIYERWGYDVSEVKISKFKIANQGKIDSLRTEWERSYDDFDVARKRGRIERLAYLARTQMDRYQDKNEHSVVYSREIRAILEQIRKEVEGDKIQVDINGQIDVSATINMNLSVQRLTQKISISAFVVSLVASKRGIDPLKLMNRLSTSFYNQYNGFTSLKGKPSEIEYPSNLIQSYDWNQIDKMHRNDEVVDDTMQEAEIVEEETVKGSIKDKMFEILNSKQDELNRISKK